MKKGAAARGYPTRPPRLPPPPKNVPSKRVRFIGQDQPVTPSRPRTTTPSSSREAPTSAESKALSETPRPSSEPPVSSPGYGPPSLPDIDEERRIRRDYERSKRAYRDILHDNGVREARIALKDARGQPLNTSELNEIEEDQRRHDGDYSLGISFSFRLNNKKALNKALPDSSRWSFSLMEFEDAFFEAVAPILVDRELNWQKRTLIIRHGSGRGGSQRHDFDGFSPSIREELLEVLDRHRESYRSGKHLLIFDLAATVSQTSAPITHSPTNRSNREGMAAESQESPSQSVQRRSNRSDRLHDQQAIRMDRISLSGDF